MITTIDHVCVQTGRLELMSRWYSEVLGLRIGDRPDFKVPGAWLYAGEKTAVHLLEVPGVDNARAEETIAIEHFAFQAKGLTEFEKRLALHKQDFKRTNSDKTNRIMIDLNDPDGNHIHIDFSRNE